jgi:hypothetical protein
MPESQMSSAQSAPDPVMLNLAAVAFAVSIAFVVDQIMPVVPLQRDSYKFPVYDASHVTDDVAIERAIGDSANAVHFNRTYVTGGTSKKSLKADLPREIVEQNANPTSVENQRVLTVTTRIKIGLEKKCRDKLLSLAGQATPSVKWDASSGVVIKKNIDAGKKLFRAQNGGIDPNTILIPYDVAVVISNDPDIIARDKRTTDLQLTNGKSLPDTLFGMKVVIAGAMSKDTPASAFTNIWNTDDVWLLYVDPSTAANGGDVLTFGAQFRSPARPGVDIWAMKWQDPDPTSNKDWYAVEVNQDENFISDTCALRISDVLT